ncbi:hypothetical protein IOD16_19910 [Saccharothrix sp. 6-C]|uniref:helix-hairpin-helix domain-containing protein n=1 Tax=Saccharothrix sp. 6-C TaxID=2781735 RepID=UPI001917167D|nr:helix-hairpin-helix domain-containing protein [Saccharothrix sp. 6-C]QQQ73557.1 hypothetical protein IOD16_19910 [Saccharothrix sp. 6-C]
MTTTAQLRETAMSLPEVAAHDRAFTVRGERFASVDERDRVDLHLPAEEVDAVLAAHPTAERLPLGVRVPLGDVDGQRLDHWVRRAWLWRAREDLAARAVGAGTAEPGEVGDLPKGIGRPAARALAALGVTTLAQVARLSDAELLAVHGVGPKAVRVLREELGR